MPPKPLCKYDPKCYRTSADHRAQYRHTDTRDRKSPTPMARPPPATASPPALKRESEPCPARALSGSPKAKKLKSSSPAMEPSTGPCSILPELPPLKAEPSSSLGEDALAPLYHLTFPPSVLQLFRIASTSCPKDPLSAFHGYGGWILCGPFDILYGKKTFANSHDAWMHYRYPFDPPECLTIAISPTQHMVLHWDDPSQLPTLVAVSTGEYEYHLLACGNVVDAMFVACAKHAAKAALPELQKTFGLLASPESITSACLAYRKKHMVAPTFSKMGILVPYDKKSEVGYRDMMYTDTALKAALKAKNEGVLSRKRQEEFDEQMRMADISNDESDFGLSLQLGLNLFCYSIRDNQVSHEAQRQLDVAYMLLGRTTFQHILRAHMAHKMSEKKGAPENHLSPL